jgi:hypothetical protein
MEKNTTCRGCGKLLEGDGSQFNAVYDPETKILAKWNYFGGWVCSERCDYDSCLELERSMPGHMGQRSLSIGSASYRQVKTNWKEANK